MTWTPGIGTGRPRGGDHEPNQVVVVGPVVTLEIDQPICGHDHRRQLKDPIGATASRSSGSVLHSPHSRFSCIDV